VLAQSAIVVGVDGSAASRRAVEWAAREAAGRKLPLTLIAVTDPHARFGVPDRAQDSAQGGAAERISLDSEAALRTAADIAQRSGMPEVLQQHMSGGVIESLLNASEAARMLVVGTTGCDERPGLSVGSTAQALATHAACPVAVISRGFSADSDASAPIPVTGPVIVGVDGSPVSDGAVAAAFTAALWRNVPLVAVHASMDIGLAEAPTPDGDGNEQWEAIQSEAEELVARRLAPWRKHHENVDVSIRVELDRPVRALARLADEAQLVVVGSRGRGGFNGMRLGSTSTALMHTLETPMLIVRAQRKG
jgi:nucleotide-binding universal stress UspA family protein